MTDDSGEASDRSPNPNSETLVSRQIKERIGENILLHIQLNLLTSHTLGDGLGDQWPSLRLTPIRVSIDTAPAVFENDLLLPPRPWIWL